MKNLTRMAEKGFTGFTLMLSTSAWIDLYAQEQGMASLKRLEFWLWVVLIPLICCIFLLGRKNQLIDTLKRGSLLFLFVGIILLSTLWSDVPGDTLKRGMQLSVTTLFGVYFATRYTLKEQVKILGWVFLIAAIFSILYVFGMPQLGITQTGEGNANTGTWRGIFAHKNVLGRMMSIGGIFFLINAFNSQKDRWIWWFALVLTMILLNGANSKAALLTFLFLAAISPFHKVLRWHPYLAIPIYIIVVLVGGTLVIWLADNFAAVMDSIDKDPDLNGRVPIWKLLFGMLEDRPWLGFGYGGFWRGWAGEKTSAIIMRTITWKPKQPHNGFIDVLVDLGILGASVGLTGFLVNLGRAIICIRNGKTAETLWPLSLLTMMLIANQTDNMFMQQFTIHWVLYVTLSLSPLCHQEPVSVNEYPRIDVSKNYRVLKPNKNSIPKNYRQ